MLVWYCNNRSIIYFIKYDLKTLESLYSCMTLPPIYQGIYFLDFSSLQINYFYLQFLNYELINILIFVILASFVSFFFTCLDIWILCKLLSIFVAFSRKFSQYLSQCLIFFETLYQCIFISKIEMLHFIWSTENSRENRILKEICSAF